ncbi:putative methionyl-tRNA synthetase [Planoprotostelium fungivorum]|uniref:Putative methionyl-tRNA synthetase n=1 Tax=Planoprotostelium fungivorum TaxID=1890364 RepID=A0A2P6MWV6_9EUKA|nr:putative methionyl-tRNA synthetase [Planoprotostelium fungivorum]
MFRITGSVQNALLTAAISGVSAIKPVKVDEVVKSSEELKKASPEGKLPAFSGSKTAAGFYEVVKAFLPESSPLLGKNDAKNVEKWISFVVDTLEPSLAAKDTKTVGNLKKVNKDLASKIFVSGLSLTVADLALYSSLQAVMRGWTAEERNEYNHITRFVDTIQHQDKVSESKIFTEVSVHQNVSAAPGAVSTEKKPAQESKEQPNKTKREEKKGGDKEKPQAKVEEKKTERKEPTAEEKEAQKKAKEDRKAKNAANRGGQTAPEPKKELPVDVSRLDIRVGKIVDVKKHESADALYVEQIDVGEEKPRQVVSGLVKHVPIEQMKDRMCIVLCNLKPSALRGVTSHAMVMCANSEDKVEVLSPPEGAVIGERVKVPGFDGEADEQLNPKQKIFEQVAVDLKTNEEGVACFRGVPWVTSKGHVSVPTVKNGGIK